MENAVFSTFFVIEHELHGEPGIPWPSDFWGLWTVTDEIARIRLIHFASARNSNV
jgi:hypothetical protein